MAFDRAYLSPMTSFGHSLPTLWVYASLDSQATIDTSAYFPADAGLNLGDVIMCVTHAGGTLEAPTGTPIVGFHIVSSVSATVVDVSDTLAVTATDTD